MRGMRLFFIALASLVALGSGIAVAEQGGSPEVDSSLSTPPDAEPGTEIAVDRTANSETFRLPNGERETRIYAEPVNYDDSGEWRTIGSALRESGDGAVLTNGGNDFEISLPQQLDSNPARISFGDQWISSQLLNANTEAVDLEGKTATYENPQGNVAFSYSGLANGLKEDIELGNSSQPSSFTFLLKASSGLTPALTETGDLEFRDQEDRLVATVPAPLMYDSAPEHPATSRAIHFALEPAAEGWRLKVEADREWLDRPERVWPVHLDPSTVKVSTKELGSFDCAINGKKGTKGTTVCGSKGVKELTAAYWPKVNSAEDEWSRLLTYFDIHGNQGPLPKGAYVTEATLSMWANEAALNTSGIELGLVEKKVGTQQGPNWLEYEKSKLWTQEGGDYKEVVGKVTTAERGPAAGWWNIPLAVKPIMEFSESKPEGQAKAERIVLLTKLIDDKSRECSTSCTQRQIKFESSAATTPANRPYLSLKYYMPAPATAKLTSPLDGTQSARRVRLKASWESGITGVNFQYRKGNKGRFEDLPTELVKDAEGKAVSAWPIPVTGLEETKNYYLDATALEPKYKAEEGKLQLRALFFGGAGTDGYSTPSNVIVNPDLGGTADTEESVGPGSVDLLTGNYTMSRTDFTLPAPIGSVDVSRTYSSRDTAATGDTGVLGRGWQPTSMVESANGADWRSIVEFPPSAEEAEFGFGGYVHLTDLTGSEYTFEKEGESYFSPPELEGWQLTHAAGTATFTLSDPSGNKTVFTSEGGGAEYLPTSISLTGTGDTSAKYVYTLANGRRRLKTLVGPGGYLSCSESSKTKVGCHVLEFSYKPATTWGAPEADGERLASITYWGPEGANKQGHWEVAKYEYDSEGRLIAEWDPRLASPLKETYTYVGKGSTEAAGQLRTMTPPGQEPWTFEYKGLAGEKAEAGRLSTIKRASLLASPSTAQTTIAYGVPLSGSGAPNQMSLAEISKWGQEDLPLDATAIFGPDEVPASPPSGYSKATVFYMDSEGQTVNTARGAGAGMSGPSISTTETDEFGNVVRELSPQNRLRALEAGAGSAAKSREIDSKFKYSKDGTELREEFGPLHQTRIAETGETKPARMHTIYG